MDAVVHDFLAIDPVLLLEIRVEPSFDVLNDGSPAVRTHQHVMQRQRGDDTVPFIVVNKVAESGCVDNRQTKANATLFNVWCLHTAICEWDALRYLFYGDSSPALILSMATVEGLSALGGSGSFGGYSGVLKRVLMSVDLPRPDSPGAHMSRRTYTPSCVTRTDNHGSELEALPHALPVDLVGQVGKAHKAHELFADDGGGADFVGTRRERRAGTVHPARPVGGENVAVASGSV